MTAGIGFTIALFVIGLSLDDPAAADLAKIAIFAASVSRPGGSCRCGSLRAVPCPKPLVHDAETAGTHLLFRSLPGARKGEECLQ